MRLTKLEMHGFKSFADNTQMVFDEGVTAIVGPNGCGKSNVSDAVRWVLGEQRARLLRGGKMEDVIFQGSSARRAVNVAEVSLVFENSEGILPVPFQEVVITRRLSRSGESDYFLNRAPCRLKDIHDLLRGTGLGAETGVVIESKMIDLLLSDRADDRRELFEEAAGVGLYRDRRRTTERRLEETTADLQRLDDLIGEVQSQVRSLARQRGRAERHAKLMERRFTVEIALAAREMEAWAGELARLEGRLVQLRQGLPGAETQVTEAELARDSAHAERATAEATRGELSRLVAQQREQVQQVRAELAVAEERQRNAVARRQRAEMEATEGATVGSRLSDEREQAAAERTRLEEELATIVEMLRESQHGEEEARRAVATARAELEGSERAIRELQERVRRVELDRERAGRELEEVAQRSTTLEGERVQLADREATARRELEEAQATLEEARTRASMAADALELARAADRDVREREAGARAELFRADEALTALQGRVNGLEQLERERVGLAPAAARLLKEKERFPEGAVLGPLSDFLSADQGSATLVERFLGATVHAVLVRDRAAADAVRAWHAEANPGPLLLLPLDAIGVSTETQGLASLVNAKETARGWVRALLGKVESVEGGTAFVDARGAVWLPGSVSGPGPLRRRAELESLREEMRVSEQALATAQEEAAVAQRESRVAADRVQEVERRHDRAAREAQEAAALADRLAARHEELSARRTALEQETTQLATAVAEREQGATAARESVSAAERAQDDARERRAAAQVEDAQARARLQVSQDRERRLNAELQTAAARLEALRAELSELAMADSELAEKMAQWRLDLEGREGALQDVEGRLADAERGVREADERLTAAEHALDETRRQSHAAADELHHAELRYTELSGRRTIVRERLETEWRKPLEEMLANAPTVDMDDAALRAEAEEMRAQLEQLGVVNALAIEEHEETVRRLDFLTQQRTDLFDARSQLTQAIREIDATARELFLATFTQVRENFRQIFMSLFGGGECDLRLENPESPLDCDIEIHASPRGKRTQRINLLSSGERALVALSLLFGIFLTKPSPFCLLDEVDAPLDDANVGRFVRMLNEFKRRTQFIVITHNPRTTTEAADAVYGVTMQEPGVSSLVSVRMKGHPVEDGIPLSEAIGAGAPAGAGAA